MKIKVGIIGVGHLASYLVEGFKNSGTDIDIILSPRNSKITATLATKFDVKIASDNQEVADYADIIILSTRPRDIVKAANEIEFRKNHTIISVAAGVLLETLKLVTTPGTLARALPITCAAVNKSPTLIYPNLPKVNSVFSLLGQVHPLSNESSFTPASVISAFYGWIFALAQEVIDWTIQSGVSPQTAKNLVLETMEGMAALSLTQKSPDLHHLLKTLTTPGGITELGLEVLKEKKAISNWNDALNAVLNKLTQG